MTSSSPGCASIVLAEARAGHSLDEVDASLEDVNGLRREDRAVLWLYGWASAAG